MAGVTPALINAGAPFGEQTEEGDVKIYWSHICRKRETVSERRVDTFSRTGCSFSP